MSSKGDPTGKELELTAREKKILGFILEGTRHEEIAKALKISVRTLYRHLKDIKDKCGFIPAEIIASMALEMVRQLNMKLQMAFEDLLSSWKEWKDYKALLAKARTKPEQKKWNSLSIAEQIKIEDAQVSKQHRLEASYTRAQMAHSFAMKDIIHFKKAIGVYAPDLNLIDASQHQTNIIHVDAENALDEVNEEYGEEMAEQVKERIIQNRLKNEPKTAAITVKAKDVTKDKKKGGKKK